MAALVGVALTAGCGIRTTSVPVDAGAAPTRVACSVEDEAARPTGVPLRVFLVCGSQLDAVERPSTLPEEKAGGDPVRTASALLAQLQSEPSASEAEAGFSTAVKGPLVVTGGHRGDPAGTLRLSRQPEDLTATALSQIVCTFAASAVGGGGTVVLGGPGAYPPRRYQCTEELRERPDGAPPTVSPSAAASGTPSPAAPGEPSGAAASQPVG
ncbi:hypothetical protein [Streptomyces sp. NBC_01216]|uniref:hypothetical protein n=1 Tax=unclassified Streptomyces TaxID=2593676 RepID=UPI002E15BEC8|nr:hypothetical protein OG393_11400 [Streptomyces sp. NBC_01216]